MLTAQWGIWQRENKWFLMLRTRIESVENYCMVESESQRDSLTRLYNRGYGEMNRYAPWRIFCGQYFGRVTLSFVQEEICKERILEIQRLTRNIKTPDFNCNAVGLSAGCTIYGGGNIDFEDIYNSSDFGLYE